jgi:hypothetical protein
MERNKAIFEKKKQEWASIRRIVSYLGKKDVRILLMYICIITLRNFH